MPIYISHTTSCQKTLQSQCLKAASEFSSKHFQKHLLLLWSTIMLIQIKCGFVTRLVNGPIKTVCYIMKSSFLMGLS